MAPPNKEEVFLDSHARSSGVGLIQIPSTMYPIHGSVHLGPESPEADKIRSAALRLSRFLPGPSPLHFCPDISEAVGRPVYLKLEHTLPSGAFKIRGTYNKISQVMSEHQPGEPIPHFVASSTGNHVLACCLVWQSLGIRGSHVFVPNNVAPAKEAKLRQLHDTGLIRLTKGGREILEAEITGRQFTKNTPGSVYIPSYADWDVIRGQGSSAFEIFPDPDKTGWPGQLPPALFSNPENHVTLLVPVGGGSLISGIALYAKQAVPIQTTVIGCQPALDYVLAKSVLAGRVLSYEEAEAEDTISNGTAGGVEEDSPTLDVCRQYVDRWCMVDEKGIAQSCLSLEKILGTAGYPRAEPSASLGFGALMKLAESGELPPGPVVVFVTGGNVGETEMKLMRKVAELG